MVQAAAVNIPSLSATNFATVYNLFSLAIACLLFTSLYLVVSQRQVVREYRTAVVVSATVCGIAAYHYFRIFNNFQESYPAGATIDAPHTLSNIEFNEGYRYVDWLLTVPLLLLETVAVMALGRAASKKLLVKLIPASALMIALGYPGELSNELGPRLLWGTLSTIPFLYLLYVLFVELSRSLDRQPPEVVHTIKMLRLALVGLWGVYPIAYLFPVLGGDFFGGEGGFVLKQVGYSLADILAKAAYGLAIYKVARVRSRLADPAYDDDHAVEPVAAGADGLPARTAVAGSTPVVNGHAPKASRTS
ncbi:bacteriorhodopsin-like [Modestobacter sp. VKM Ac-2986]|uniref:bacteriorhodopsin-like n=1 Tax=Modestobacter sp. VKM Ac-2986 TaxID=3004140 RepID=UPI0022AA196C|nr:bacteriorhodopsin-like [Modestobacter sp. VKM Ac-2986]MCZ2829154.1 bacteriorhodopsin-like [Modestobacter sp. VKM Ac-2986]